MTVLTAGMRFIVCDCITCGVQYALPKKLDDQRVRDKTWTYCPNGHQQHYLGKTPEAERDEARRELRLQREANERLANDAMNQAKEIKRLKRHASAGLCSFCRRHFVNLERHVKSKHKQGALA